MPAGALTPLEVRLRKRLAALHAGGAFLGCQVAVLDIAAALAAAGSTPPGGAGAAGGGVRVLVDVAGGQCGPLDPRPVTPATPFPVLGLSRVGVAAAVTHLARSGRAAFDSRVDAYWPLFGAYGGKAGCSVGELLRGRSGVEGTLPADLNTGSLARGKWDRCAADIAQAQPLVLPSLILRPLAPPPPGAFDRATGSAGGSSGSSSANGSIAEGDESSAASSGGAGATAVGSSASGARLPTPLPSHLAACFSFGTRPNIGATGNSETIAHLWYGWGWAVGSMVAGMAGGPGATPVLPPAAAAAGGAGAASAPAVASSAGTALTTVLRDAVCPALGVPGHATFGLIPAATPPPTPPAAAGGKAADPAAANVPPPLPLSPFATVALGASGALDACPAEGEEEEDASTAILPATPSDEDTGSDEDVTMTAAMAAVELAELMTAGGLMELSALTAGGKEHLMDPRVVNMLKVREALLPSTNMYASAMSVARMGAFMAAHAAAMHASTTSTSSSSGGPSALVRPDPSGSGAAYDPTALLAAHHMGMRLFGWKRRAAGATAAASSAGAEDSAGTEADGGNQDLDIHCHDPDVVFSGFGASALGGSLLVVDTVKKVAVAVTVNRLTADRALSKHVLDIVAQEVGLGAPVDF